MTDDHATFEQPLLDVAQTEPEAGITANRMTDDRRREPVSVTERFRLFHQVILNDDPTNVTTSLEKLMAD
ncbi:hypothetical protein R69746_07035 [Paraburkholderia aspalathi]|nr:hypothetical protein R69746_07035 [Paraburkholderia aspalathi]